MPPSKSGSLKSTSRQPSTVHKRISMIRKSSSFIMSLVLWMPLTTGSRAATNPTTKWGEAAETILQTLRAAEDLLGFTMGETARSKESGSNRGSKWWTTTGMSSRTLRISWWGRKQPTVMSISSSWRLGAPWRATRISWWSLLHLSWWRADSKCLAKG